MLSDLNSGEPVGATPTSEDPSNMACEFLNGQSVLKRYLTNHEIRWIELHCRKGMELAGYPLQTDARFHCGGGSNACRVNRGLVTFAAGVHLYVRGWVC